MYNVLICDDDVDIVNALKIYLNDPGYTLFTAYNGMQALEVMGKEECTVTHMTFCIRRLLTTAFCICMTQRLPICVMR